MSPRVSLLVLVAALLAPACSPDEPAVEPDPAARYVRDVTCSGCHAQAWRDWTGSHHELSLQEATEATVLGDFGDTRLQHGATSTRFFRRGDRFMVETTGRSDPVDPVDPVESVEPVEPAESRAGVAQFEVRYVLGVEPLQQLLIELPGGRVQCLSSAWDSVRGTWFSLHPGEEFEATDPRHWTGRYQRWNARCATCHSTAVQPGYDAASDTYSTCWVELNVGCQACHGPGSKHLTWSTSYDQTLDPTRGLEVRLGSGAAQPELNTCAPCHARRQPLIAAPAPGAELLDGFLPERLRSDLYFPDGQPRAETYVYGSFQQSRMHAAGVTCTDCHAPHGLGLLAEGNALCMQCHSTAAPLERFPTLRAKDYDSARHHHHERGTVGAACVSCHMPEATHLIVDVRREHAFRVPRPDLSVTLGVPNACNACHTEPERDAAWAAERIEQWYGGDRTAREHFALTLALGQARAGEADPELAALARDRSQPPIVRATALDLLQALGPRGTDTIRELLDDPDPLVRSSAARAFELLPPARRKPTLALLDDPVRAVRISAAQGLGGYPREDLEPHQLAALEAATAEFLSAQALTADLPAAHITLARYYAASGDEARAVASWERALEQDPWQLDARLELVDLLHTRGERASAEQLLRAGIALQPGRGELHHVLGLLLSAGSDAAAAAEALSTAARLLPDQAGVQYEAGLALVEAHRDADAERLLMDAALLAPRDPLPRHALVVLHLRLGQDERALEHARVLAGLVPGSPQAPILLERMRAELGASPTEH